ncbi:hypothetical protein BKA70DRAFT_533701 [Coprinopsis sp. MPI-PUGE-AT-0042]|nr:hypothetical protein BKA70DRAFT_533701 [Coprinopsis sp. MPI-PUGE-AT-0042]
MARFTLSTISLCLALLVPLARAECSLPLLKTVASSYVAAQTEGVFGTLSDNLASAFGVSSSKIAYTENFNETDISKGILSQPLKIDSVRSIHDTVACATFTELIVTDPAHPYVIGTQIRLPNTKGKRNFKVETLITDQGDWLFNATGTLYWSKTESWPLIPEKERDSRETLKKAADAYLDKFNDNSVTVPFNLPCARLEGGIYTGTGAPTDSCDLGFPTGIPMLNRRYVIDPSYGSIEVMFNFGGPTSSPDSHLFRLEKGKIRYAHTMTVLKCNALPEDPCNA